MSGVQQTICVEALCNEREVALDLQVFDTLLALGKLVVFVIYPNSGHNPVRCHFATHHLDKLSQVVFESSDMIYLDFVALIVILHSVQTESQALKNTLAEVGQMLT